MARPGTAPSATAPSASNSSFDRAAAIRSAVMMSAEAAAFGASAKVAAKVHLRQPRTIRSASKRMLPASSVSLACNWLAYTRLEYRLTQGKQAHARPAIDQWLRSRGKMHVLLDVGTVV